MSSSFSLSRPLMIKKYNRPCNTNKRNVALTVLEIDWKDQDQGGIKVSHLGLLGFCFILFLPSKHAILLFSHASKVWGETETLWSLIRSLIESKNSLLRTPPSCKSNCLPVPPPPNTRHSKCQFQYMSGHNSLPKYLASQA